MKWRNGEAENDYNAMVAENTEYLMKQGYGEAAAKYAGVAEESLRSVKRGAGDVLTPTLDLMMAVKEESENLSMFLMYLMKKYAMFEIKRKRSSEEQAVMSAVGTGDHINIEEELASYFGVDLAEAEKEKREILEALKNGKGGVS